MQAGIENPTADQIRAMWGSVPVVYVGVPRQDHHSSWCYRCAGSSKMSLPPRNHQGKTVERVAGDASAIRQRSRRRLTMAYQGKVAAG